MEKPLLVVSHSAVTPGQLRKWEDLSLKVDWPIVLAVPSSWPEGGVRQISSAAKKGRLRVVPLKTWFEGRLGYAWMQGLASLAARISPAAVYAEEEPFIPLCWQALRVAKKYNLPFGFFTWENQVRSYRFWQRYLLRKTVSYASLGIAGNRAAEALLRQWAYRGRTVRLPQYGVSPAAWIRPAAKAPFCVGYAGRLVPEKGVDCLIEAMAGQGWHLLIAGTGPQQRALEKLARRRGVPAVFKGYQNQAGMNRFYKALHVLALPSRQTPAWAEQFGRVLAEAMARGIACVGSHTGAIAEVTGKAALRVPDGDVQALRAALKKLAGSSTLRQRLGREGRARVKRYYTCAALTEAMKKEMIILRSGKS